MSATSATVMPTTATRNSSSATPTRPRIGYFSGLARAGVLRLLRPLQHGAIEFREPSGAIVRVGDAAAPPAATPVIEILDPHAWTRIALGGANGAAQAFFAGHWRTDNLVALMRLMARNRSLVQRLGGGIGWLGRWVDRWMHALRDNSRTGSRRNIADHYDLGNDFYALWLDESLTYSAAWFSAPAQTLEAAQAAKYERICAQLQLGPADHVLEIGTGWGGFARHAASTRGCRVTTTTISAAQYRLARARIDAAGLAPQVELRLDDYRELRRPAGGYSAIVSIEMIEAVGHRHHPEFIAACDRLLATDGRMALQMINMPDAEYARYRRAPDVIQRVIFPGSCCPSFARISGLMAARTNLELVEVFDLTADYAETLRRWHERFRQRLGEIRALGFDERFLRIWEYYLSYCEAGFAERATLARQAIWARPAWRSRTSLGEKRGES